MLKDKIALVTGGAKGIGKAISMELAMQGAKVIVNYKSSEEEAFAVVNYIKDRGGISLPHQCDISNYGDVEKMVKDIIMNYGGLDIVVNNAGITCDKPIIGMKEKDYDMVLDTNLKGAFWVCRHCARPMIKQKKGVIINISSVSGLYGNAGQSNYASAKAGIGGLTKSLAKELAPKGIRVNAVAPGFINTEMTESLSDELKKTYRDRIAMGRFGRPEEVAHVVTFLATDHSSYMTGQILSIDGGIAM